MNPTLAWIGWWSFSRRISPHRHLRGWREGPWLWRGGGTRSESVARGVFAAGEEAGVLLVHDAVRPFVSGDLITRVLDSAREHATVPVVPVTDTIKSHRW